jgi:hypothetical protein
MVTLAALRSFFRCTAGLAMVAAVATPAAAIEVPAATTGELEPPRITLDRDRLLDAGAAPRDAQGRPVGDVTGLSLRLWSRHGRSDLGIGVGTLSMFDLQPLPPGAGGPASLRAMRPTVSFAWRYRVDGQTAVYADATSARRLAADAMPDLYATKVGMEWKLATSRFGFENRSLGLQLQSGYRMSLRVRGGGLGVYFRGNF